MQPERVRTVVERRRADNRRSVTGSLLTVLGDLYLFSRGAEKTVMFFVKKMGAQFPVQKQRLHGDRAAFAMCGSSG